MTKKELIKKLQELSGYPHNDPEEDHVKADNLLLDFIGDKEVLEAFRDIEKWYA